MEYRNESKYICSEYEFNNIYNRVKNIMAKDKYMKSENGYNIRSVYFDDYENSAFYSNDSGINEREKIRIRIYDGSSDIIKLEIKSKKNGYTKKVSTKISKEICDRLLNGETLNITDCHDDVMRKMYILMNTRNLKPMIIVEYDRYVFVNDIGNVRITFDRNTRASKEIGRFFEKNIYATPILDIGEHILEVKYDEIIPDYIVNVLELGILNLTTFSKYYLSELKLGGD